VAWRKINSAEVLRIAPGHLDDLGIDFDELAAPLLPSAAAFLANRQGNLVIGAASFGRTAENLTCHEQQRRIVIEW